MSLAVLAVAGGLAYRRLSRPVEVRVTIVETGAVREETIGPGTVQARYSVSIGVRVSGTLERVLVDVGDEVKKDQLLAQLDTTELAFRLRAAQGAVASARQEVALAQANLTKAQSDRDIARLRSERARSLAGSGVVSVAEADDATAAFRAAVANERAARATIDVRPLPAAPPPTSVSRFTPAAAAHRLTQLCGTPFFVPAPQMPSLFTSSSTTWRCSSVYERLPLPTAIFASTRPPRTQGNPGAHAASRMG